MNKEVLKIMNRKEETTIRKWLDYNGYKIMRVIFFPIWIVIICYRKFDKWANKHQEWSKERADKILSYYIPRRADWISDEKIFYFFDNGIGWGATKYIKIRDRRWWKVQCDYCGGEIRKYLLEEFELEGFKKIIGDDNDNGRTEVSFIFIEDDKTK